jgi:GNAT superfamily N-acetyltransferase
VDVQQLLELHDQHQRIEIEYRSLRREATPDVVRHVALAQGYGVVLYSRLSEANVDQVIGEQIAYFNRLGQDFEWKTYDHDTPGDLRTRLIARGFEAEEPEALLVLDMATAPANLLQPVRHDVRRITDPEQLEDYRRIQEQVWNEPIDWQIAALRDDLLNDPDHVSVYIAYAAGRPVSAARIDFHDLNPFAGLWGGSTLAEYRGRGFYTALLAARLQEAQRRGVRFLTIDASPMSRPIVEQHGFRFLTFTQPFCWRVGNDGDGENPT